MEYRNVTARSSSMNLLSRPFLTRPASQRSRLRRGFTLIELLLVMGIIASLASIVIIAINPKKQLGKARDAQRQSTANQLEKAMSQYFIDNGQLLQAGSILQGEDAARPVCKQGVSSMPTCINLDQLAVTYIGAIPQDAHEACSGYSGYSVYKNAGGQPFVVASHISHLDPVCLWDGLSGHWRFHEGTGIAATDLSGSENNATVMNGAAWTSGRKGYGIRTDGINDYVHVTEAGNPEIKYTGQNLTVALWIKAEATETNGGWLLSNPWNGGGYYNYYLYYAASGQITFFIGAATSYSIASSVTIPAGSWHHVAATVDASKAVTLYIDGTSRASGTHAISSWTPGGGDADIALAIGTLYPYGTGGWSQPTFSFQGTLDDVRVYNRALGADDILALASDYYY